MTASSRDEDRRDLHAIIGIDDGRRPRRMILVHRWAYRLDESIEDFAVEPVAERHRAALSPRTRMSVRRRPQQEGEWTGITRPSRRGSSSRFLTDVIVDMGLVSRGQVEEAIESSRSLGTTPERVLLDGGALTQDGLSRALAERYGLDHLDLGVFPVDMCAANLVTTTAAKRYQAVPVAFADKRTLLVAMADPVERPRGRRHRDHDRLRGARRGRRRRRTSPA